MVAIDDLRREHLQPCCASQSNEQQSNVVVRSALLLPYVLGSANILELFFLALRLRLLPIENGVIELLDRGVDFAGLLFLSVGWRDDFGDGLFQGAGRVGEILRTLRPFLGGILPNLRSCLGIRVIELD